MNDGKKEPSIEEIRRRIHTEGSALFGGQPTVIHDRDTTGDSQEIDDDLVDPPNERADEQEAAEGRGNAGLLMAAGLGALGAGFLETAGHEHGEDEEHDGGDVEDLGDGDDLP